MIIFVVVSTIIAVAFIATALKLRSVPRYSQIGAWMELVVSLAYGDIIAFLLMLKLFGGVAG